MIPILAVVIIETIFTIWEVSSIQLLAASFISCDITDALSSIKYPYKPTLYQSRFGMEFDSNLQSPSYLP